VDLRFIDPADPLYDAELELRYRVLREPLGYPRDAVRFPFEDESLHLIAIDEGRVVGCVLFHPDGEAAGRLFQMAVDPARQGTGIGRRLVIHLEAELHRRGVRRVTLHARAHAIPFYEKLGYDSVGEPYLEVGIPHRSMTRVIA
jgi:predicted N-acetyltransferase YhbS